MSIDITLKHSSVAGKVPNPSDLKPGEVAVNSADVKAFIKDKSGAIVQLAGPGSDTDAVLKVGDTMTGALVLPVAAPTADAEAANKKYVDDVAADAVVNADVKYVEVSGDSMTGQLVLPGGGGDEEAIQKQEVEALISGSIVAAPYVKVAGDNMTGDLTLGTDKITLKAADGSITAAGTLRINDASGDAQAYLVNDGSLNVAWGQLSSGLATYVSGVNGQYYIGFDGTANSGTITMDPADGSITAAGDVKIGGLSSAPNITLAADGTATFKGRLDVAPNGIATSTDYVSLYAEGAVGVRRNSGTGSDYLWVGISGTTETSRINKNGSASFAGDVTVGGDPNGGANDGSRVRSTGLIQASRASNLLLWAGHTTGGPTATSTIKGDGSATFAGAVSSPTFDQASTSSQGYLLSNAGALNCQREAGNTKSVFLAYDGTTNTVEIKSDGSATFAGDVKIGPLSSAPNITLSSSQGSALFAAGNTVIADGGNIYMNSAGSANSGNSNLTLNATDGSITAAGSVSVAGLSTGSNSGKGVVISNLGYVLAQQPSTAADTEIVYAGYKGTTQTFNVESGGSINAAGDVKIGGLSAAPNISLRTDGSAIFKNYAQFIRPGTRNSDYVTLFGNENGFSTVIRRDGVFIGDPIDESQVNSSNPASANITLNADGTASFAGNVQIGEPNGNLQNTQGVFLHATEGRLEVQTEANADRLVFRALEGNAERITFKANGSAKFAGDVVAGGSPTGGAEDGVRVQAEGRVQIGRSDAFAGLELYQTGTNSAKTQLFPDGSAEFAGKISSETTRIYRPATGGNGLSDWFSDDGGTNKKQVQFYANGNADFRGTVASNGLTFKLEADDDTKYTATTNEEGEQNLVYNGAVLDVKDRLQKADAALLALKTAAVVATDFASLKAAIVTALADV